MRPFQFNGSGSEYFKIWIVNALLTLVTVGLYYPWAKVRKRRYFYANTTLDNRNFDYHATGKQLFLGYVIAMILLIIFVVINNVSPEGSLILMVLTFLALPWVIWRSLKFNLKMTSFSNVRFGFNGGLGGAYLNFMVLPTVSFLGFYLSIIISGVVVVFTSQGSPMAATLIALVLAVPVIYLGIYLFAFVTNKKHTYTIGNAAFGQGKFFPNFTNKAFVIIALKTLGFSILVLLGYVLYLFIVGMVFGSGFAATLNVLNPEDMDRAMQQAMQQSGFIIMIIALYIGLFFVYMIVFSYYFSKQRAYIFANTTLDGTISLQSTLKASTFFLVMVTNLLMVACTLGLAHPWAAVRMARLMAENTQVSSTEDIDVYLTQQSKAQSALGEEIGEAFDVDVGIGF